MVITHKNTYAQKHIYEDRCTHVHICSANIHQHMSANRLTYQIYTLGKHIFHKHTPILSRYNKLTFCKYILRKCKHTHIQQVQTRTTHTLSKAHTHSPQTKGSSATHKLSSIMQTHHPPKTRHGHTHTHTHTHTPQGCFSYQALLKYQIYKD